MRRAALHLAAVLAFVLAVSARSGWASVPVHAPCDAAAAPGPAAAPALPAPVSGALAVTPVVTAGETVVLRWDRLEDADEVEIVLSLDGGRSFPVRVSPELEAREGEFHWSVPDLPAARARLMLRAGDRRGERVVALSREFRIEHAAGVRAPGLDFHEGELWTGLGALQGAGAAGIAAGAPRFEEAGEEAPCLPPPPALRAAPAPPARAPVSAVTMGAAPPSPASVRPRREVPLRI